MVDLRWLTAVHGGRTAETVVGEEEDEGRSWERGVTRWKGRGIHRGGKIKPEGHFRHSTFYAKMDNYTPQLLANYSQFAPGQP